ncbi:MAG: hypothetical protein QM689_04775 [Oscillospiraceae bacterium]
MKRLRITASGSKGTPADDRAEYFMVKLLKPGALDGLTGVFAFDDCFETDPAELAEFEKLFSPKVKEKRPGQLFD